MWTSLDLARQAGLAVSVIEARPRWRHLVADVIESERDPLTHALNHPAAASATPVT
jgi:hypothetical protein